MSSHPCGRSLKSPLRRSWIRFWRSSTTVWFSETSRKSGSTYENILRSTRHRAKSACGKSKKLLNSPSRESLTNPDRRSWTRRSCNRLPSPVYSNRYHHSSRVRKTARPALHSGRPFSLNLWLLRMMSGMDSYLYILFFHFDYQIYTLCTLTTFFLPWSPQKTEHDKQLETSLSVLQTGKRSIMALNANSGPQKL